MKIMRSLVASLAMILLSAPVMYGQDLSKYRNFSLGMTLVELSSQVDLKPLQPKLIHKSPAVIQELTWWPRERSGSSLQVEPVWQVFFSFYNGELYRVLVTYDRDATDGLTAEDMIQAVSAQYGTATRPDAQISFPTNELHRSTEKVIARWEDSQYSINLFRPRFLNSFGLVMLSKRLDGQAEAAIAESVKLEAQGETSPASPDARSSPRTSALRSRTAKSKTSAGPRK